MKLTDWMDLNGLCVGVTLKDKKEALDILSALQQKCGNTLRSKDLLRELLRREDQTPFAIGAGVAVCYLRTDLVKRPLLTAVTVPAGVDLNAPDGEKSRLLFLAVAPYSKPLDPTPKLTVFLMNENLREQLMDAADEATFLKLIALAEAGKYPAAFDGEQETPLILAVVDDAMEYATEAAAQLQLTAGKIGMLLKIEREGEPLFSSEDLHDAKGILLLGDDLESERFNGKPLMKIDVSDGLYRSEHILKAVKNAPIFHKKTVFKQKKRTFSNWYYRSNVPLLPLILLTGGIFLLASQLIGLFLGAVSVAESLRWIGERTLLLLIPRVCGMLGFRYARWQGLTVGLIGGAILEAACGGVWAALAGGFISAVLMQWTERRISSLSERFLGLKWLSPTLGVAGIAVVAFFFRKIGFLLHEEYQSILAMENLPLKALVLSAGVGFNPGGTLDRMAASLSDPYLLAAISSGGIALSIGLTVFCILQRKKIDGVHCANGWGAFLGGICGAVKSYIVFYAGDPFRIAPCAAAGAGAAGLLAVSFRCQTKQLGLAGAFACNRPFAFWIAAICGAVLSCSLLYVVSLKSKNPRCDA